MKILITGGAGFVGSHLAFSFRSQFPQSKILVLDNLRRRGSEINVGRFKKADIDFVHGDIRCKSDLFDIHDNFDLMVEASAEPSVNAGNSGAPNYVVDTNLVGTINCLEFARSCVDRTLFLSTSRVYSIPPLRHLPLKTMETRFELEGHGLGYSPEGISEAFPVNEFRSLYGATKLASEYFVQEYSQAYGLKAQINRCGVIAGPGQFGKVDQGVFTLWVAHHFFNKSLSYMGFGGKGLQVRDLLHPDDLFRLLIRQLDTWDDCESGVYNIGGGSSCSTSLLELTGLCQEITGHEIPIVQSLPTTNVDIPYFVTDFAKAKNRFNWSPTKSVKDIVDEIHSWLKENQEQLRPIFG